VFCDPRPLLFIDLDDVQAVYVVSLFASCCIMNGGATGTAESEQLSIARVLEEVNHALRVNFRALRFHLQIERIDAITHRPGDLVGLGADGDRAANVVRRMDNRFVRLFGVPQNPAGEIAGGKNSDKALSAGVEGEVIETTGRAGEA